MEIGTVRYRHRSVQRPLIATHHCHQYIIMTTTPLHPEVIRAPSATPAPGSQPVCQSWHPAPLEQPGSWTLTLRLWLRQPPPSRHSTPGVQYLSVALISGPGRCARYGCQGSSLRCGQGEWWIPLQHSSRVYLTINKRSGWAGQIGWPSDPNL